MRQTRHFLFFTFLICPALSAQTDSIALDQVDIADRQLRNFSNTQGKIHLNDSVISRNHSSLTSLLEQNSPITFRQNGYGMVSSASFRGTSAQQTAVIWNGINVNSQLNGQTDFNSISATDFNSVTVRAGGGSPIYGTSAIGGSIHLSNKIPFGRHFTNQLFTRYGSFNTSESFYRLDAANDRWSVASSVSYNASDNDYDFPVGGFNINGQYWNFGLNTSAGYKINERHDIRFFSRFFSGDKHFSLISPSETKTKYADVNSWNMLEWNSNLSKWQTKARIAFLDEKYKYFADIDSQDHDSGNASTTILKYDAQYQPADNFLINAIAEYSNVAGGGSDIESEERKNFAAALLIRHRIVEKLTYELGIRRDFPSDFDSPILLSGGLSYRMSDALKLRTNFSRNFRIPTFNDLYWSEVGDPDLKPETSLQGELGFDVNHKNFDFSVTGYIIDITDMIQWLPGTTSVWNPQNVRDVRTSGVEAFTSYKNSFGSHQIVYHATYAYTFSENNSTGKRLIYVPLHKITSGIAYTYSKISFIVQGLYNDEMFTRSDNNPRYNVDPFLVLNAYAEFAVSKSLKAGVQAGNLLNEQYETVSGRPMPGINYNLYLHLKL